MFRTSFPPLAYAALALSLITFSSQAMPFSPRASQLPASELMLVAETCAAGSIWHPRLHRCVNVPSCGAGSVWHPRLHTCVSEPTCAAGSVWHPRLHTCVSEPTCGAGSVWHPRLHTCVTP
jgi:hypothetical protein